VFLEGLHGFAGWANGRALEIAGITARTPDPPDGHIVKDRATGRPTGILINEAQALVTRHIPPPRPETVERAIRLAAEECLENGLTTVHDANADAIMLEAMRSLARRGELGIRVYAMLDSSDGELVNRYFEGGPAVASYVSRRTRCTV
jgi:predicted amidohydrolase YtcJ